MNWEDQFEGFDKFHSRYDPWAQAYAMEKLRADPNSPVLRADWRMFYEEGAAAQSAWHGPSKKSPQEQDLAASRCLALRPAIEAGDGGSLLEAVARCAACGLAMPSWVALHFVAAYYGVQRGDFKGWDDAFGPVTGDVRGRRARGVVAPGGYRIALELLTADPAQALDNVFYEKVAGQANSSKTQIQQHLKQYVADRGLAPLQYLKDRLMAGETLHSAESAWFHQRMDAWTAEHLPKSR